MTPPIVIVTPARYPFAFNPVTEPRGRARVRWHDLLAGLDGVELTGDPDVEIDAITHDSRLVAPGACFACIPGAVTDGHDHARAAIAAGAVALLVERPLPFAVAQARVPSVRAALGPAAAALFGWPSAAMRTLGVTGTNGKTTTTYLLEAIARSAGDRVGVIGTVGARITSAGGISAGGAGETLATRHTTPEASELQELLARMRDAGVATVAMEVSSHALEQHRVDGTRFAAVCFTNLSHDHLDYHGSLDAYFDAKARLFDSARATAAAVNVDDARGDALVERARATGLDPWTYAVDSTTADVTALVPEYRADGTRFTLVDRRGSGRAEVHLGLVGAFNLANALAAATTGLASGFDFETVAAGLTEPLVVPGRFEPVDAGQPFLVLVDYAHTPDALSRVLAAARLLTGTGGRVICVFGCGGDRDAAKRPLMGRAVAAAADVAVLTSDNPRSEDPQSIADAVLPGLADGLAVATVELDRRTAIVDALAAARAGDVVVLAGKGHETGQTTAGRTVPFDDRTVAREALGALGWK